ncbi:DNA recombination protein RmuC [Marinicella sp. S1101]|uniref:DNA recombination protein RmuC n=1 Tax=Marinicella marina TaxID=2996016 RepID=UPI0022609AD9|nr:DNA recombination protein RmuC [Marinicella marina]MCX7554347.1 DNA recombination protein RmuC [Marinicella marina]MDJ1138662.1 DNA recombination protein RmuC [Marinicella marina]
MNNLLSFAENYLLESLLASLFLGVVLTALMAWLLWRKAHQQIADLAAEKRQAVEQMLNQQLTQIQHELEKTEQENEQQDRELMRLNKLTVKLAEQHKYSQEKAILADERQQALIQAEKQLTELKSEVEHQQQRFLEQTEFIKNSQATMSDHFSTLGQKILEEKTAKFTDRNKEQMNQVVTPLQKQLQEFQTLINRNATEGLAQQKSMKSEIERVYQLNQELNKKAEDLTKALTSESKTQGNWGEMVLHRLLDVAGLEKGREYETEVSFSTDDNKRLRPDVLIHLPQNKTMIVDAKVSLTAFEQYVNAETDTERQKQLKQHVQSMKSHIDGLTKKSYHDIEQLDSLDFVLMFVPIESAYLDAINAQPNLLEDAYKKNVLVVSASNLLATLRTVMVLWQNENQNKNAQLIADRAGKMYDKLVGFVENLNDIKFRLKQADEAWYAAENKLKSGRGNLISQADKLKQLGARNSKLLDKE